MPLPGITEVIANILQGIFANKATQGIDALLQRPTEQGYPNVPVVNRTLDVGAVPERLPVATLDPELQDGEESRFVALLRSLGQSNVYLFVELTPSTAWNLVSVVVEDVRTGDWYPLSGDYAFQGTGGGWERTQQFVWTLKTALDAGVDARLSLRIARSADLHGLYDGRITWAHVKEHSIPAVIAGDKHLQELRAMFESELNNPEARWRSAL